MRAIRGLPASIDQTAAARGRPSLAASAARALRSSGAARALRSLLALPEHIVCVRPHVAPVQRTGLALRQRDATVVHVYFPSPALHSVCLALRSEACLTASFAMCWETRERTTESWDLRSALGRGGLSWPAPTSSEQMSIAAGAVIAFAAVRATVGRQARRPRRLSFI